MINFKVKRIMLPYDFSANADKALAHAAFITNILKADLYIVHVISRNELVDIVLPMLNIKTEKVVENLVNERMTEVCERVKKQFGIKAKPFISTGNKTMELVNLAEENKIDLIVMGTQGKDSKSEYFLGSTAYRLITKSPVPVMTIKNKSEKKGYQKILLPIDLSQHSRQKVNYAIALAKAFGGKVTVLALYNEKEKSDKFKLEVIANQIEKLCESKGVLHSAYIDKTHHRVSKTLSFAKKHKCDLIVTMTDQTLEGVQGILSTYDHELVHTSKIPVISIPPELSEDLDTGSTPAVPF
jgi:nucleotide-binding universal stress UspA family protein